MALVSLGTSTVAKNFNPNFLITSQQSPTTTRAFLSKTSSIRNFDITSSSYSITRTLALKDNTYLKRSFRNVPVVPDYEVFSPAQTEILVISTFTEVLVQSGLPFWS
jgi:hypothetical protein